MVQPDRLFIGLGALLAFAAVGLGAFGAHGLASYLDPNGMRVYQTGVQYHLAHSLGLILLGMTIREQPSSFTLKFSAWAMIVGTLLFSGSLYLLAVLNLSWLGMITPLGGLLLLISWLSLAYGMLLAK